MIFQDLDLIVVADRVEECSLDLRAGGVLVVYDASLAVAAFAAELELTAVVSCVIAVGGSDVHSIPPKPPLHPHGLGNPCTWIYARGGPSEEGILEGIREGHVFISDDPNGAQLVLTADADGNGKFDAMMGDTVEAEEGRRVSFRVWTNGGSDRRLWIICDGLPLDVIPLDGPEARHSFSLELSGRSYVRAELRGFRGRPERGEVVWAMTNPIWLKALEAS